MWYLSPDLLANLDVFGETDGKYFCRSYESGKLRQAQPESRSAVAPVLDLLGFEKLARVSESNSVLFIQGKNFAVKNADLSAYRKIKNLAIAKGVILPPNISEVHWTRILERLFAEARITDPVPLDSVPADEWHSSGLGRFLVDARKNQIGPFAGKIIMSRAVLDFVRRSGPPELWQTTSQRGVASVLASMGYQAHDFHEMEHGKRRHRRAWYPGSKKEFLRQLELKSEQNGNSIPGTNPENLDSSLLDQEYDGFSAPPEVK